MHAMPRPAPRVAPATTATLPSRLFISEPPFRVVRYAPVPDTLCHIWRRRKNFFGRGGDAMRADRLVSIMLLWQLYRRLTAAELARRLEVSERTILRDMDALSTAGVPVTALRGTGGGWALAGGYRTNLTGLNAEEIQTLFAGLPDRLLSDLNLGRASDAAHVKLLAALPAAARAAAEYARSRIHVDVAGWGGADEALPHLPTIQEAVWQGRQLLFAYGSDCEGGAPRERRVSPLGLVAKGGVWYLVALSGGEARSYRVSRVASARMTDEPCERPEGFDLAAFWAKSVRRRSEERRVGKECRSRCAS